MSRRENFFNAMRRITPQKVPYEFRLCPSQVEQFKEKTGTLDYNEYFDIPIRHIGLNESTFKPDYKKFYPQLPEQAAPVPFAKEWGVYGVQGALAHFQRMFHPMESFQSVKEVEGYPYPDLLEPYRWDGLSEKISVLKAQDYVTVADLKKTIFETSWFLRGMDSLLVDFFENPDLAEKLFDIITEFRIGEAANYAKLGVDLIMLGDDVSTQLDMMISPDLWRKTLKPRLRLIISTAKSYKKDVLVFYHGCGNLQKIIPDLIEIGVDILNPIQPECMNVFEIKKQYGEHLSFWGGLGTQTVLPFGTVQDIMDTCKSLIDIVGKNGGLLIAPTHVIEPEVPWENILAIIEAVDAYGTIK